MRIPLLERFKRQATNGAIDAILRKGEEDHYFVEQFKALRTKIEYKADMLKLKVIAVTSAIAGEGKTMASAYLAMNLASGGRKKILLIDTDLRKSDLARGLGLEPRPGLSEFMAGTVGEGEVIRNSVVPGLQVIPAGTKMTSPADMLSGEKFHGFLSRARAQYDIVLLDTPPILPVADTLSLREQVDGFVFVFRAGHTPHGMLKLAVEEIGEKRIMGVVLNGIEPQKQGYYAKYYGNYYRNAGKERTSG